MKGIWFIIIFSALGKTLIAQDWQSEPTAILVGTNSLNYIAALVEPKAATFNIFTQIELTKKSAIELEYLKYNGVTNLFKNCDGNCTEKRFNGSIYEIDYQHTFYPKWRELYVSAGVGMMSGTQYDGVILLDYYVGTYKIGTTRNMQLWFGNLETGMKWHFGNHIIFKPSVNLGYIFKDNSQKTNIYADFLPGMGYNLGKGVFIGCKFGFAFKLNYGAEVRKQRTDRKLKPIEE